MNIKTLFVTLSLFLTLPALADNTQIEQSLNKIRNKAAEVGSINAQTILFDLSKSRNSIPGLTEEALKQQKQTRIEFQKQISSELTTLKTTVSLECYRSASKLAQASEAEGFSYAFQSIVNLGDDFFSAPELSSLGNLSMSSKQVELGAKDQAHSDCIK